MRTDGRRGTDEMPNLDLLRSIAVLLVVVEHMLLALRIERVGYWQIPWLGVVGVFMFFVHTSLVLMWSLDRHPNTLGFYIRRAFRIYPLAIAVVLITVIGHIPTIQSPDGATYFHTNGIRNVIANICLVQNLVWSGNILGVMWTLPLEVDMYFLLPFLYFFLQENFSLWPLLALWAATVAYDRTAFASNVSGFGVCIPYFLAGVIAYVLFAKVKKPKLPAFLMPVLIFVLLALFMIHPAWRSGWYLTFALGVGLPFFRQIRMKWLIRSSHEIAKYSYGIYLAHAWCISLGVNYLHNDNPAIRLAAILVPMAVIVVALHFAVEKPGIEFGAKLARKWTRSH
ncbi:MAG TPA: acyltransferase, partial [Acidobacteriaceae bacterium]